MVCTKSFLAMMVARPSITASDSGMICFQFARSGAATELDLGGTVRGTAEKGYLDFVCLMKNARLVVTDFGGIQEESICLGVPCVTLRENTERPVTLASGMNVLSGVKSQGIRRAIRQQLNRERSTQMPELWDGRAAHRIVKVLASLMEEPNQHASTAEGLAVTVREN